MDQYYTEYNKVKTAGDSRTFDQWLTDHVQQTNNYDPAAQEYLAGKGIDVNSGTHRDNATQQGIDNASAAGAARAAAGGNTDQVQVGNQTGVHASSGTTTQEGTTADLVKTTGSGTSNNVGTSNQTTSGTSTDTNNSQTVTDINTQAATTNTVDDTLGMGALLSDQGGMLAASDAERNAFLTDVMQTGGSQFNDQLQAGINNSLSGPGMVGVGNGARGRVAGSAAADIGRNNLSQRLEAAQGLTGITGIGTAAGAASPYLGTNSLVNNTGQTTANTTGTSTNNFTQGTQGSTTNVGNTTNQGTQSSTGVSSLVGTEAMNGVASGTSSQVATGNVPESQSGGGGCYVCTAYHAHKLMGPRVIRLGAQYKLGNLKRYGLSLHGYSIIGPAIAKLVFNNSLVRKILAKPVRAIMYEECRLATGVRLRKKLSATIWHGAFHHVSQFVGKLATVFGVREFKTRDNYFTQYGKETGLWFPVNKEALQ